MFCVRKAVASVLPWKDDEGVRTLFSLNLAHSVLPPSVGHRIGWTVRNVILSVVCSFHPGIRVTPHPLVACSLGSLCLSAR